MTTPLNITELPTPRTDKAKKSIIVGNYGATVLREDMDHLEYVEVDFACTLEQELAEAKERARDMGDTDFYTLRAEHNSLREQVAVLTKEGEHKDTALIQLDRWLTAAIKERDAALAQVEAIEKSFTEWRMSYAADQRKWEAEVEKLKAERDDTVNVADTALYAHRRALGQVLSRDVEIARLREALTKQRNYLEQSFCGCTTANEAGDRDICGWCIALDETDCALSAPPTPNLRDEAVAALQDALSMMKQTTEAVKEKPTGGDIFWDRAMEQCESTLRLLGVQP